MLQVYGIVKIFLKQPTQQKATNCNFWQDIFFNNFIIKTYFNY